MRNSRNIASNLLIFLASTGLAGCFDSAKKNVQDIEVRILDKYKCADSSYRVLAEDFSPDHNALEYKVDTAIYNSIQPEDVNIFHIENGELVSNKKTGSVVNGTIIWPYKKPNSGFEQKDQSFEMSIGEDTCKVNVDYTLYINLKDFSHGATHDFILREDGIHGTAHKRYGEQEIEAIKQKFSPAAREKWQNAIRKPAPDTAARARGS